LTFWAFRLHIRNRDRGIIEHRSAQDCAAVKRREKMRLKTLGLVLLSGVCLSFCATTGAKDAKIYRDQLEPMLGKDKKEVTTMITGWDFQVLDSWSAENPDAETIKKHDRPATGFSKSEVQGIFAQKGKYDVMVFSKKTGTDSATTGQIDEYGRGVLKDKEYTSELFAVIRTVFRDGRLASHRVWPNLTSTSISGGVRRVR
jgi:hypothetical protein